MNRCMALVAYPVWGNKFDSGHRKLSPGFNLNVKYTSPDLGAQEKKLHKLPGVAHLILAVFGFLNILYFLPFILYNNKKLSKLRITFSSPLAVRRA